MRSILLLAACAAAVLTAQDSRNVSLPGTDTVFRMPEYRTRADWEKRRQHLRKQILSAAGLYPMPAKPKMQTLVFGRIENKDYSIEKVAIETMPGYWLGGNLYRPLGKPGRHPAVASPHGHWTYGRLEHQPLASVPARAINLARLGFVVMTYDMVGYTDTIQTPHAFGDEPRDIAWNFGPLPLQLWNSIRVVDFLQTLPDVDPDQIGATGASGGGTQTFLLAAVDDRVKFAAPVNMISSIMQGGSPCENAPGLRVDANNMEFGAMMAPRPMIMVAATGDWTKNTPAVEYPAVRHIYELYDAADKLATKQIDSPHNYNQQSREAVYRFFAKTVLHTPNADAITERSPRIEKLGDMLVWHNRTLPAGALDFDGVRQAWHKLVGAPVSDAALAKERLQLALASEWPVEVSAEGGVLSRQGRGDSVPYVVLGTGKPSRVVVHPDGIEAARAAAQQWVKAGETVLLMDAFQTGSAKASRNRDQRHFLTFNKSDDAERVQDILTALRWSGARKLNGIGAAGVWALYAAAAAPVRIEVSAAPANPGEFLAPGIERVGGLALARRLAGLL
jgi:dienelactone hydrolase